MRDMRNLTPDEKTEIVAAAYREPITRQSVEDLRDAAFYEGRRAQEYPHGGIVYHMRSHWDDFKKFYWEQWEPSWGAWLLNQWDGRYGVKTEWHERKGQKV